MPLNAKFVLSGETICSLDIGSAVRFRLEHPIGSLSCSECESVMYLVGGLHRLRHFRHRVKCTSQYSSHPESIEHFYGKSFLRKALRERLSKAKVKAEVVLEHLLPHVGAHGRKADVAAILPGGDVIVYECQLANTSVNELEKRTDDYESNGIDVTWFLGGAAYTDSNREWSYDRFGDCHQINIDFSKSIERIDDHMYNDFDEESPDIGEDQNENRPDIDEPDPPGSSS